jgi:hypothetical protein
MAKGTCSIDGCESPAKTRGWCNKHYLRWQAHGDPEYVKPPKARCAECDHPVVARGLCGTHYARWRRTEGTAPCSIDGCARPLFGHGWCELHYDRWRRNGDPTKVQVIVGDDVARFLASFDMGEPDDCWRWNGTVTHEGYGVMSVGGRQVKAHRYSFEHYIGPIPDGQDLDHTCHNRDPLCHDGDDCLHRRCVNPRHVEPVNPGENVARGNRHRMLRGELHPPD